MEKIDPHNSRKYLQIWKEREHNLSKKNSKILREYIDFLERKNRSSVKILAVARQLERVFYLLELHFNILDITKIKEKVLIELFHQMNQAKILNSYGKPYLSTNDYATRFKAFWHWYMKEGKKNGENIIEITGELNTDKRKKSIFAYFTNEELEKMMEIASYELRILMIFLFDTGIRSPTEAFNIRVNDFRENFTQLNIRDNISKTFGRQIKLMMCSEAIKNYIKGNNLNDTDRLFPFEPATINKQLKKIGKRILGDKETLGRKKGSELTMYDFRHSSGCYWLPRYKSESALMYRFAWKNSKMIHYYTELLGMKDTISEEDMLIDITKSEIERRMLNAEKENKELKSRMDMFEKRLISLLNQEK